MRRVHLAIFVINEGLFILGFSLVKLEEFFNDFCQFV
jgi:hypothetical protein